MRTESRSLIAVMLGCVLVAGCQTPATELSGIAELPPLDYAVLVTGGAFLAADGNRVGTFADRVVPGAKDPVSKGATDEPIPMEAVLGVLDRGRVFRRVAADPDEAHRRAVRQSFQAGGNDPALQAFLQGARDQGYDLLLVVDELVDGPIEAQGVNGRWPVTFVTWILLGVGMLIPDHTFESRATLRVTVRDLQTGRVLHDPLLVGGPIDLSLTERSDALGLITSILVPPFWVGDDPQSVGNSVREVVQRRMLLSLARDLKSESVRQRLRERSAAAITLVDQGSGPELVVESAESLSSMRLRAAMTLAPGVAEAIERDLLASMRREGLRFRYTVSLPPELLEAELQVLVGTIRGDVASITLGPRRAK